MTHQCVSQSRMTVASLDDGGGGGYALLARCYGCRGRSWMKEEGVGTWIQTGSPRHSPCFQTVRAGRESRDTPGGVSGNHCCCCCTSNLDGNVSGILTPLDKLGDLMARGQMRRLEDHDPVGRKRLRWPSCANIQPLCPSPTVARSPCLAPSGGTALCLVLVLGPFPNVALTLGATLHPWLS